jgi:hypothetical protein
VAKIVQRAASPRRGSSITTAAGALDRRQQPMRLLLIADEMPLKHSIGAVLCALAARSIAVGAELGRNATHNRTRRRCRQTPSFRALPTDASAMTQRVTYSAIAGIRHQSRDGFAARSLAATARLYAPGRYNNSL